MDIKNESIKNMIDGLNDEQKKCVLSNSKRIMCIAGPGCGKTNVLTKRILFLAKEKNVPQEKILAITFTKKARDELKKRLEILGLMNVNIHTFNSFCERIIRENYNDIYKRNKKMISYQEKLLALNIAISSENIEIRELLRNYFNESRTKKQDEYQLLNSFLNDCFYMINHIRMNKIKFQDVSEKDDFSRKIAIVILRLNEFIEIQNLRDFGDQIADCVDFMKKNPAKTPKFEHILIDEYQDVNQKQVEIIDILNPDSVFAVGDPRQAIFGWRGSNIKHILEFKEKYRGEIEEMHLYRNYRSGRKIINFMNLALKIPGTYDLTHFNNISEDNVTIRGFGSEEEERSFIINEIQKKINQDVFILARTKKQLEDLSIELKKNNIEHTLKSDEVIESFQDEKSKILLATVHSVKGLEADNVFLIGANEQYFPCKSSEHKIFEIFKLNEKYNKYEEEKRLFYVGISRAKKNLVITYTGKKPTHFINEEMMKIANIH